ncbi:LHFPL tetraspan subfamily member 6 protein-like [Chrysoperla carnea]|uniref:LHFPL tetraspan subfamily member 6 protein-like n=1 Tax=Chrysoperla carnea TaxID=189513 RepID=UPI001D096B64|nr:LHFPL tetraspan subfamily member 6 protein-like [Chrysoperla carnea]
MATSLTCVGIFWALLSFTAAISCFTGFYLPFWIKGRLLDKVDAYFSTFRRCNYPKITTLGEVQIIEECGRYSRFADIPSIWWQISTILVGIASALSLLVSITALAALCLTYVVHDGTARVGGAMQLLACLLLVCGLALYPLGWDNKEIKESCGDSATIYNIGTCEVSWSAYILTSSIVLLFLCFCLSFCASRYKISSFGS